LTAEIKYAGTVIQNYVNLCLLVSLPLWPRLMTRPITVVLS